MSSAGSRKSEVGSRNAPGPIPQLRQPDGGPCGRDQRARTSADVPTSDFRLPTSPADALIAAAVDGQLDDAQAAELAALVAADPTVGRRLRTHLLIAEVAAQELVPERGAVAFAAGLGERRRAEDDGFAFLARVRARIAADEAAVPVPPATAPPRYHWWLGATAAAAAAAALVFALSWPALAAAEVASLPAASLQPRAGDASLFALARSARTHERLPFGLGTP